MCSGSPSTSMSSAATMCGEALNRKEKQRTQIGINVFKILIPGVCVWRLFAKHRHSAKCCLQTEISIEFSSLAYVVIYMKLLPVSLRHFLFRLRQFINLTALPPCSLNSVASQHKNIRHVPSYRESLFQK